MGYSKVLSWVCESLEAVQKCVSMSTTHCVCRGMSTCSQSVLIMKYVKIKVFFVYPVNAHLNVAVILHSKYFEKF